MASFSSDSSDYYSDWMQETGFNLSPPKRRSMRARKKKKYTSTSSEGEDTELEEMLSSPEGSQTRGKALTNKQKQLGKKKKKRVCSVLRENLIIFLFCKY